MIEPNRAELLAPYTSSVEAEHAVRGRDEFLSVAAHELRTPVTSLRGFAQLAVRQLDNLIDINQPVDPADIPQPEPVLASLEGAPLGVNPLYNVTPAAAGALASGTFHTLAVRARTGAGEAELKALGGSAADLICGVRQ